MPPRARTMAHLSDPMSRRYRTASSVRRRNRCSLGIWSHNAAMTSPVLAADTWAISGPRFLLYFAVAALASFFLSGFIRRALYRGSVRPGWEPNAEQLAYFSGGARQAVLAALAGLRADQAVSSVG